MNSAHVPKRTGRAGNGAERRRVVAHGVEDAGQDLDIGAGIQPEEAEQAVARLGQAGLPVVAEKRGYEEKAGQRRQEEWARGWRRAYRRGGREAG